MMNIRHALTWALGALFAFAATAGAGEKTQSFPAKKGGTLEVRVDGGEITVRGWDKEEVAVRVRSISEEQLKSVTIAQSGTTVEVGFKWKGRKIEDMEFDISVPSSFNTDLKTAGGEISLQSPLTGSLKGSTAGGSVKLGNVGGTVEMETAGGEISGGEIAGTLDARTAGGDIEIKSVSDEAEVSTAGGSIEVGSAGKGLRASTAGGNITLGKISGDLTASTAGGSVRVESAQGEVSLNTAGGNIKMGSARGKVKANTAAGNISLGRVEGTVSARSSAGNVSVTLDPSADGSSSLSTSAGNIELAIPEKAKATITARAGGPFGGWGEEKEMRVSTDFGVLEKEGSHGEMKITLGGGGHKIKLEAMMGEIKIKKAK